MATIREIRELLETAPDQDKELYIRFGAKAKYRKLVTVLVEHRNGVSLGTQMQDTPPQELWQE